MIMPDDPNQFRYPIGYICPACNAKLYDRHHPFCGECGQPMPSESQMQATGLTIYPYRYGRPIRELDQIAAFLHGVGTTKYWLEEYHPTFRTTKIRVARNGNQESDHEIVCTSTMRLELPIDDGWCGVMSLCRQGSGTIYLYDEPNRVSVTAGTLSLHSVNRS